MSQQQYRMSPEVAKAPAKLPETHRDLAPVIQRLFMHWNLRDDEQLALLGGLRCDIAAGLSRGEAGAHGVDQGVVERIGHLLAVHQLHIASPSMASCMLSALRSARCSDHS